MSISITVPSLGESIKQATLLRWIKPDGAAVAADEPVCELETDKANVDVPAPIAGVLHYSLKEGATVDVGQVIANVTAGAAAVAVTAPAAPVKVEAAAPVAAVEEAVKKDEARLTPVAKRLAEEHKIEPSAIPGSGPSGRRTKEDVLNYLQERETPPAPKQTPAVRSPAAPVGDHRGTRRESMSKMRKRIAQRLVEAQHTAAILTTFNEVDLQAVNELRARYKDRFSEVYGVGLGYMSFFARAAVLALREFPAINAFIEGDEIVYHDYVHLGVAVSTDRGLAVPVLRNVQDMSFARIENEIKRLATAARDGKLAIEELSGGTFTVTNGGVFGSLLSTPILNPPQSGILGMHAIQKRPVVVHDKIEIRPMMYVALSYDHRIVDGRQSVSFLVRLKQYLEDPARLMLEI